MSQRGDKSNKKSKISSSFALCSSTREGNWSSKDFEIDEKPSEEPEVKDSKVVAAEEDNSNSSDDQVTEQENSTSDDTQTS